VGRFILSVSALLLEVGTTVGIIESLMASRTVAGAAVLPFRLQYLHPLLPCLLVLWSLSPIGGQAALRAASTDYVTSTREHEVRYLDLNETGVLAFSNNRVLAPLTPFNTAFATALLSPLDTKQSSQDLYGNLKVPMIEPLVTSSHPDQDGWYAVNGSTGATIYSSINGLPFSGLDASGNSTFDLTTSYFLSECTVRVVSNNSNNHTLPLSTLGASNSEYGNEYADMVINLVSSSDVASSSLRGIDIWSAYLWSYVPDTGISLFTKTKASCDLSQTNVDVRVWCIGDKCGAIAVRRSLRSTSGSTPAIFSIPTYDAVPWYRGLLLAVPAGTSNEYSRTSSMLLDYIASPALTIGSDRAVDLSHIGDDTYSERLSQLLNTYWLSSAAPFAVLGNFQQQSQNLLSATYSTADSTAGSSTTGHLVFRCVKPWLILLYLSSGVMLLAGIACTVLNALRRGPDVLDTFVLALRDNEFARIANASSMDNGNQVGKRLKYTKVRLGDVRPDAEIGHVAVATPGPEMPVNGLQMKRLYD
jgi:hypothetical protein